MCAAAYLASGFGWVWMREKLLGWVVERAAGGIDCNFTIF